MEKNQNTPPTPAWYKEMQEWQNEDSERRSVFIVATDNANAYAGLMGYSLPILASIAAAMKQDGAMESLIKDSAEINKSSTMGLLLLQLKMKEFAKEHGFKVEENSSDEKSTFRDLLKSVISGLTDKF